MNDKTTKNRLPETIEAGCRGEIPTIHALEEMHHKLKAMRAQQHLMRKVLGHDIERRELGPHHVEFKDILGEQEVELGLQAARIEDIIDGYYNSA